MCVLMPMESTTLAVVMAVVGGMKNIFPYLVHSFRRETGAKSFL